VPFSRYAVLGLALKQDFSVIVLDSQSNKPVSSASVTLAGKKAVTDGQGKATVHVRVGHGTLMVTKTYYKDLSQGVTVTIGKPKALSVEFQATGRPVPVVIVNSISGKPVAGVTVTAGKATAKTDSKGQATVVVPAGVKAATATVAADGYNKLDVVLTITVQTDAKNTFKVTPAGKIYLLSNASGKIDVVKTNLDGSDRQVVLPGTGKEDRYGTVLFATRDWKYIALLSKRDGGDHAKLFLIDSSSNDKLITVDEGDADFTIAGWSGDRLIYTVTRNKPFIEAKRQALKTYQASTQKLTTIDETSVAVAAPYDYAYETIESVYVLDQTVVYGKNWNGVSTLFFYNGLQGKQATFNSVRADGTQKKVVKAYDRVNGYSFIGINTRLSEFGEIYIQYNSGSQNAYDQYVNGKISAAKLTDDDYYNSTYPTYVVSPSGNKTLWSDYRDGQYVFFVGDGSGKNGQQIGEAEDYTPYGWYGDDYILLTKKGSEMRIMPVAGLGGDLEKSLKISNYYKPNDYPRGYGYGYGG